MSISQMFQDFLSNLKVDNADTITLRYEEITSCLNKKYRDTDSKTANSLQVGSYGRWTAIKGISDLDMLYIMPKGKWDDYKDGKQSQLLTDTRDAIKARYSSTEVFVDRLVVCVQYKDFHVEVQPVFEQDDGSFKYPDTYDGGSWKITKPCEEMTAMKEFVAEKNKNLRRLCKMARAWKNKHGVGMGGLLIDTLAHNFLRDTTDYDDKSYLYYDWMSRDFFKYLSELPEQDRYAALGSGQHVKVKVKFQKNAKKAYELCLKAIEAGTEDTANAKWKKVYGRPFPANSVVVANESVSKASQSWTDTEEFIEDFHPVDIRFNLQIDCEVHRNVGLKASLLDFLSKGFGISNSRKLVFKVESCNAPEPYDIKWKVLNRGVNAQTRNCIRGDIVSSNEYPQRRKETADFSGTHLVECYVIRSGVVVARDKIKVPIL